MPPKRTSVPSSAPTYPTAAAPKLTLRDICCCCCAGDDAPSSPANLPPRSRGQTASSNGSSTTKTRTPQSPSRGRVSGGVFPTAREGDLGRSDCLGVEDVDALGNTASSLNNTSRRRRSPTVVEFVEDGTKEPVHRVPSTTILKPSPGVSPGMTPLSTPSHSPATHSPRSPPHLASSQSQRVFASGGSPPHLGLGETASSSMLRSTMSKGQVRHGSPKLNLNLTLRRTNTSSPGTSRGAPSLRPRVLEREDSERSMGGTSSFRNHSVRNPLRPPRGDLPPLMEQPSASDPETPQPRRIESRGKVQDRPPILDVEGTHQVSESDEDGEDR